MPRKAKRIYNHREFYSKNIGKPIATDCVIHHLDGDHYNNDFNNLICLPKFCHSNYHKALLSAWGIETKYVANENEVIEMKRIIQEAIEERNKLYKENLEKLKEVLGVK